MPGALDIRVERTVRSDPGDLKTRIAGTAAIGERTLARVTWTLAPLNGGTRVALTASLQRASPLDRALLAAGGAPWIRRRLETILARLDAAVPVDAG